MTRHRHARLFRIAVLSAIAVLGLGVTAVVAGDVTTPFTGKTVNGGTVTHEHRDGKHVLMVSSDFKVPGSPDPHWQVIDSKGNNVGGGRPRRGVVRQAGCDDEVTGGGHTEPNRSDSGGTVL
jgi:hypothetical protein